jgi:hypothetical protein
MLGRPEDERDDMELPPREGVSVGAAMMMDGRGAATAASPEAVSGVASGCSAALLTGDLAGEVAVDALGLVTGRDNTFF